MFWLAIKITVLVTALFAALVVICACILSGRISRAEEKMEREEDILGGEPT